MLQMFLIEESCSTE